MKFKAGDKVKVREDLKMYQCITSNMLKYKGRVLTIEDVSNDFYILRECGRMIHWTDDMLELVEVKNCDMDKKIKDTIKTWEDWKIDEYNNNFAVSHLNEKLPYNKQNKFKHFTDDELYILKRQAIESSWEICSCGGYSEYYVKLHGKLTEEIIDEIKRREVI